MERRKSVRAVLVVVWLTLSSPCAIGDVSAALHVYLLASSTCRECRDIKQKLFRRIRERHGDRVRLTHIAVDDGDSFKLQLLYEKRYGATDDHALKVFVGESFLSGEKAIFARLEQVIAAELAKGSRTPSPEEVRSDTRASNAFPKPSPDYQGEGLPSERFSQFKPMAIAVAGLADGLNPCAFTTLVFFISLLTALGKRKRELVLVGLCFGLAIFLTYLAVGLGALKSIKVLCVSAGVSSLVTLGVAGLALCFSGYSFYDFAKYRASRNPDAMKLKLPEKIRTRVRIAMSKHMRTRNLVVGAFSIGVIVSLAESLCTGQIYLPTILCVARDPNLAPRAVGYLVLYNVAFIVPLFAVFGVACYGVTSERMAAFSKKHLASAKCLLGFTFLALAIFLIGTVVR